MNNNYKNFFFVIFISLLCIQEALAFSSKVVCTTTEEIDNQRAIFFFDIDDVKKKFYLKAISVVNSNSIVEKTGKTNVDLLLNKNSKGDMLVLETTQIQNDTLVVFTIFLKDLNGIFQVFTSSSSGKPSIQYANFSCSQLNEFPF